MEETEKWGREWNGFKLFWRVKGGHKNKNGEDEFNFRQDKSVMWLS